MGTLGHLGLSWHGEAWQGGVISDGGSARGAGIFNHTRAQSVLAARELGGLSLSFRGFKTRR